MKTQALVTTFPQRCWLATFPACQMAKRDAISFRWQCGSERNQHGVPATEAQVLRGRGAQVD